MPGRVAHGRRHAALSLAQKVHTRHSWTLGQRPSTAVAEMGTEASLPCWSVTPQPLSLPVPLAPGPVTDCEAPILSDGKHVPVGFCPRSGMMQSLSPVILVWGRADAVCDSLSVARVLSGSTTLLGVGKLPPIQIGKPRWSLLERDVMLGFSPESP